MQNLPFAVFRRAGSRESFRGGVAIGDQVLDFAALSTLDVLKRTAAEAATASQHPQLDNLFAMGPKGWHALRHALFELLRHDANDLARHKLQNCLISLTQAQHGLPASIRNYTDFYTSIHHATNIGRLFKRKDPLPPNFQWIPLAYHGRASSVGVSGQSRLALLAHAGPDENSNFKLVIKTSTRAVDWHDRARRHQLTERPPSPWIVTMEALAPYRQEWSRSANYAVP